MQRKKKTRAEYRSNFSKSDIGQLISTWLELKEIDLADATFSSYISKARHIDRFFKSYSLAEITPLMIRLFQKKLQRNNQSNKNVNDIFIVFRGVIEMALEAGLITTNPIQYVKNLPVRHHEPDPFTAEEINRILVHSNDFPNEQALFQLGILTGLRISELLALSWQDVDLKAGRIHVRRAKVGGQLKTPKTSRSRRHIDLIGQAQTLLQELYRQRDKKPAKSYWVKSEDNRKRYREPLQFVFLNSITGRSIASESHLGKYFFKPVLAYAGVRYRSIGKTRHTFCSQMLTAGLPKPWIARQLGHSSTRMIDEHYGTWIPADSPHVLAKAEAHFERICPGAGAKLREDSAVTRETSEAIGTNERPILDAAALSNYVEGMFDALEQTL